MGWYFLFFFISGFCSLLFEIIWLRLAMAQFGVTSALVSIVISMFMAGLGLGSLGGGRLLHRYGNRIGFSALRIYAMTELLIGASAIMVPRQLQWGRTLLEHTSLSSSAAYYFFSGIWIALTLIPWCAFMGATIPVAMQAIRADYRTEADRSFSFLYLANVLGAAAGTILPLLLIELYGFHGTLKIGATLNIFLACTALGFSLRKPDHAIPSLQEGSSRPSSRAATRIAPSGVLLLLFGTGLTSMGMEVVWIRQFTPYLGTVVYAFASILGLYLIFTFLGSHFYRSWSRDHADHTNEARYNGKLIWLLLGFFALFPLITADPQFKMSHLLRLLIGICPFSAVLGFVTPMLVDRWSGGDPDLAGSAYAVNVGGCIIGPLLSGFVLLPLISERWVLTILALPWIVLGLYREWTSETRSWGGKVSSKAISGFVAALALLIVFVSRGYEDRFPHHVVLRDNTATVIATGEGMHKQLLVNGVGITALTPVTKMMAHLPLAFLDHAPLSTLTICFGMGTTYRSLLSWGIPSTAVELAPSVPRVFGYFHPDGPELLRSPLSHLIIDDGRRYLERTASLYDVITIDPPPPVEAAGSSMLYSKEFYAVVSQHLQPGGILQQWLPYGDRAVRASVARAIKESFPYVRLFQYGPDGGFHFLASNRTIPNRSPAELAQTLPSKAAIDMVEWSSDKSPLQVFAEITSRETSIDQLIAQDPRAPAMQDNRPVNEYYVLRRALP